MNHWDPYVPQGQLQTYVYLPPVHRSSTAHLVFAWLGAVLTWGYLLPWAIGATRNRTNCVATALVNIFLGWTLIGWVVALVMACGSEPLQPVIVRTAPGPAYGPAALGPGVYPMPTPAYPVGIPGRDGVGADWAATDWPRGDWTEQTMPLPTYRPSDGRDLR
jgi:hypothetical protein